MKLSKIAAIAFIGATLAVPAIAQNGPGPGPGNGPATGVGPGGNRGANVPGNPAGTRGLNSTFCGMALASSFATLPIEALNSTELASMTFMREEEKLAHDVYVYLDTLWGGRVFSNIAGSEATHTEAMRLLLVRYSLPDPAATTVAGQFQNANLQALYTHLVTSGSTSLIDALKVGATIEEVDIRDIQTALLAVDNQDIRLVYENLLTGSRNHLRAFAKNLFWQDVVYVPQFLSQAEYDAIINTPIERR